MGGRQTALAVTIALALLSSTHLLASGPPWTPDTTRKSVQWSDLVVRGSIASVDTTMASEDGKQYPSTLVQLDVSEVIKGKWEKRDLAAVLLGTAQAGASGVSYDYEPGQDVVLCLRFDPEAHGGMYRFWVDEQSFVNRDGTWKTRGRQGGHEISLDAVREAARQTDPEQMARDADAVVVGTIGSIERRTLNHDGSSTAGDDVSHTKATADYVRILTDQGMKGLSSNDSLLVRVLRRGKQFDWWGPMPDLVAGRSYFMFLKKDDVGYYPLHGFNGFLEVRGNQLILNDRLSYPMTPAELTAAVRKALSPR